MSESRFKYADAPHWRAGGKQNVLGSQYVLFEPNSKWEEFPVVLEFELTNNNLLMFGPMSRIRYVGIFEKQATEGGTWAPMVAADVDRCIVLQNWYSHLIQDISVFHGNNKIWTSDEMQYVAPHLESYFYAKMDKTLKKLLCPQPANPGHGNPDKVPWTVTSDEWKAYGKSLYVNGKISFDHTPIHLFPFYQNADYFLNGNFPKAIPMPVWGKLVVRITFRTNLDCIFKKIAEGAANAYRFSLTSAHMCIEESRLTPEYEKKVLYLAKNGGKMLFPGVTKLMMAETIANGIGFHRLKFQKVPFPEGIFVFALPKEVVNGVFKFQDNTDGKIWKELNISKLDFWYDNEAYSFKAPALTQVDNDFMEIRQLLDHFVAPPFGMPLDPDKILMEEIKNCGSASMYPHLYLNLCNFGDKYRLVPSTENTGKLMASDADLDIAVKFKAGGATADVNYMFYLFYTDVNLSYDAKNAIFSCPYLKH